MYMVTDLLLGGDLRYHLNEQGRFCEDRYSLPTKFIFCRPLVLVLI